MVKTRIQDASVASPRVNPPAPLHNLVLSIDDYYQDGTRRRTDYQAMRCALQAARRLGAAKLLLPRRTYRFDDPQILEHPEQTHIDIVNQSDLVIDGQGSELLFHHIRHAITFKNCQRVMICRLTIDWDINLSSPGVVQRLPDGRRVVRIPDDYPIGQKNPARAVSEYDTANYRWVMKGNEACHLADAQLIAPQLIHSPAFDVEQCPPLSFGGLTDGLTVVVRHWVYEATGVHFGGRGNEDLTFEDITLYQCPGHAFAGYGCERGFRLSRVKIMRRPGSRLLVSATADGCHFGATRGDIIVEDCDFSHMGDDSVNIHGTWLEVHEQSASRRLQLTSKWFNGDLRLDEGDELVFCRKANLAEYGRAVIVRSRLAMEQSVATVDLDRDIPEVIAPGDFVANATRCSSRFLIRNNHFHDHRARGMLLQARDGLVENNRIRNVMGCAIMMTTDCRYWKEGYGCQDVIVRGNVMEGCNYALWERSPTGRHMACVSLLVDSPAGLGDYPVHRNVVFENNTIRDTPGLAILIASADGVIVRDNRIIDANTEPFAGTGEAHGAPAGGTIMVTRASNVTIEGNHIAPTRFAHAAIHVDPLTTRNILVRQKRGVAAEPACPAILERL